ncbi:MAG: aconitase/3-isopropylmalate dehydratase large subunit family protein [Holophaga sp.]
MSPLTMTEKLLSRAAQRPLRSGEIAICSPDLAMGTDGSVPMALDYLEAMRPGAGAPRFPRRLVFALDHYGAASGPGARALQERARAYGTRHGIRVYQEGEGVGHQLILESCAVLPGTLAVGADSHAISYGAVNAFGTGIGSSDLAGVLLCGQVWLKVPEAVRVALTGALRPEVSAKDLALALARRMGADGANYQALEFTGPGVAGLDLDDRIVLANMAVELGAKAAIFPFDAVTEAWLRGRAAAGFTPAAADPGAEYARALDLDLGQVRPQVALPHRVDQVVDADAVPYTPVDMVYLGTCTGGRVKDFREALEVLQAGGGKAPGVRLVVVPASAAVRAELERTGMLAALVALGAELLPPGCALCCGTCGQVPADGAVVVSTANRNFKGRMGNASASIYLASPRGCAEAAVRGSLGLRPGARP